MMCALGLLAGAALVVGLARALFPSHAALARHYREMLR